MARESLSNDTKQVFSRSFASDAEANSLFLSFSYTASKHI